MSLSSEDWNKFSPDLMMRLKQVLGRFDFSREDLEELAQETLAKGWASREQLKEDGKLFPWLRTIALNLSRNKLRKKRNRSLEECPELAGVSGKSSPSLQRLNQMMLPLSALDAPFPAKVAASLRYWFGWQIPEIAAYLASKPNTVSKQISRVKSQLAQSNPNSPLDQALLTRLKTNLVVYLTRSSVNPVYGACARNYSRMAETWDLLDLLLEENPNSFLLLSMKMALLYSESQMSEYEGEKDPVKPKFQQRRELWDRDKIQEAGKLYQMLSTYPGVPAAEIQSLRLFKLYYDPRRNEDMDWEALQQHLKIMMDRATNSKPFYLYALCDYFLFGPKKAAKVLEDMKNSSFLRDNVETYWDLGTYHADSAERKNAVANFKKALQFQNNSIYSAEIQRRLFAIK